MDDKFRVAFTLDGAPPQTEAFVTTEFVCENLREAVIAGHGRADAFTFPFIAHRHFMFEPYTIALLHDQFVAMA